MPPATIGAAAELLGSAERLLSTVLQGFYQSHQATAAAVQVNNLHLVRGMLGRPGCGVLQMNGQPTAQNTRECGADGDLPGFRNWANDDARRRPGPAVERRPAADPALRAADARDADLPLRRAGHHPDPVGQRHQPGGVAARTGPRSASILAQERLFLVVQDIFLTETAELADVVLPAATWGEKTGTLHQRRPHRAPVGEGRRAARRGAAGPRHLPRLRPPHGLPRQGRQPVPAVARPRVGVRRLEAVQRRPTVRLHRPQLRQAARRAAGSNGRATTEHPDGTERLYTDGKFFAAPRLLRELRPATWSPARRLEPAEYRALNPDGKAIIKAAEYLPPARETRATEYPFVLITGRTLYHFHTRTKTARAPAAATPRHRRCGWRCPPPTPRALGLARRRPGRGHAPPRGAVRARVRISGIRDGVLFVPFHYGYWDTGGDPATDRAANELTLTDWDPVSKQPLFKTAAAAITRGRPAAARRPRRPRPPPRRSPGRAAHDRRPAAHAERNARTQSREDGA